jgi:hypothetical protein
VYNTRYAAMALPAFTLILAAGIAGLPWPRLQTALLASVLSVNGISLYNYYFVPSYWREDARSAAQYLERAAGPEDILLSVGSSVALRYYYKGDLPIARVNPRNTITNEVRELAKKYNRLWLVEIRPWESDPKARVRAALDMLATRGEHKMFAGADVYTYDLGLTRQ